MPRSLASRHLFCNTLALHHLDDGRQVLALAKPIAGSVTVQEKRIVSLFVRTHAVDFLNADGSENSGRDVDEILPVANDFVAAFFSSNVDPFYEDLPPIAVDLCVELRQQRRAAS